MSSLHLGKRPASYDKRDLRFADVRPADLSLPTIPKPHGGYGMDFGKSGWLMLGNGPCDDGSVSQNSAAYEGAGDCAWAGPAHETMESNKNAGRPVPKFTCLNVLKQYSAYSGYNLTTGANDNGSDVREVLKWRQSKGLTDTQGGVHKIGAFVALEPGNLDHLWDALWLFEAVGIGVEFPTSAMDQFNNGNQIWSVVAGAQIDGGHYVPLVGHPSGGVWTCVTWGCRQTLTSQWLTKYCDEAWAWIDAERYSRVTGETQQGFKDIDLEKYISLVAQTA